MFSQYSVIQKELEREGKKNDADELDNLNGKSNSVAFEIAIGQTYMTSLPLSNPS